MTELYKFNANELKERIYYERNGTCEVCGKLIPWGKAQLAHRISKSKNNLKKYGKTIIHSPLNLALTDSLKCNSAVNISNNPAEIKHIIEQILDV